MFWSRYPGLYVYVYRPALYAYQADSHSALFYTKEEMGMRMAYWFGFAAVAGAFGGLIAFGVQHIHGAIAHWKILFLIEGLPTILIGFLAMVVLPNRPEETSILNEREREIALDRANRGKRSDTGRVVKKGEVQRVPCASQMIDYVHSSYNRRVQGLESMPTHSIVRKTTDVDLLKDLCRRNHLLWS